MRGGAIARRYARALFLLGEERGDPRSILSELDALAEEVTGSEPLRRVLFVPIHPRSERLAVMEELIRRLSLGAELRAFAFLLIEENRVSLLGAIREALRQLVEQREGRLVAEVTVARELEPAEVERVAEALARRVGARVTVELNVDERILGGVVARVGDLLLDGSVRTQLASLAGSLARGSS